MPSRMVPDYGVVSHLSIRTPLWESGDSLITFRLTARKNGPVIGGNSKTYRGHGPSQISFIPPLCSAAQDVVTVIRKQTSGPVRWMGG